MLRYLLYFWPLLLQALLIIHVFKTGRDRFWVYLLIFVPGVGGIAYVVVELLPDLLRGRNIDRAREGVARAVLPNRELEQLAAAAERSPTVDNRKLLAAAYMRRGEYANAAEIYRCCLAGPFGDDARLKLLLGECLVEIDAPEEALPLLEEAAEAGQDNLVGDARLLLGRALQALGRNEEAVRWYTRAIEAGSGLGYRYALACHYRKTDSPLEARHELSRIIEEYRLMPRHSRKLNIKWFSLAKRDIQST